MDHLRRNSAICVFAEVPMTSHESLLVMNIHGRCLQLAGFHSALQVSWESMDTPPMPPPPTLQKLPQIVVNRLKACKIM